VVELKVSKIVVGNAGSGQCSCQAGPSPGQHPARSVGRRVPTTITHRHHHSAVPGFSAHSPATPALSGECLFPLHSPSVACGLGRAPSTLNWQGPLVPISLPIFQVHCVQTGSFLEHGRQKSAYIYDARSRLRATARVWPAPADT
jgi:hypothetical protein